MMKSFKTTGICAKEIRTEVDDSGKIISCEIVGGCPGNSEAVCKLAIGRNVQEVVSVCKGIKCGQKETSCPAQLAAALETYMI